MNRKKALLVLAGAAVLISACEKEVSERGSGEKVSVNFVVNSAAYGASEGAMRGSNFNLRKLDSETVITHFADDYYLYVKLVADGPEELPAEEMRATTSNLMNGQLVHIVAYDPAQGGAKVDEADFYADNAGNIFVVDPSDPLEVEPGVYDFAAYSYYRSTDALAESNIDPTVHDLVWGEALNQTIAAGATNQATVPMTLKHLFSRVRVKINAGDISDAAITGIGTVTVAGGQKVDLTVKSGSLAPSGTAVTQSVGNWADGDGNALSSPFSEEVIVSDYALFYPSPTKVTLGSISMNIGGTPKSFSDHSATFTQALVAGQHYTLVVDLKQLVWAGSNIFYSGTLGTLTFEEPGSTKTYQGMFFKWGSLIAISCYGLPTSIPIVIPPVLDGESWDISRTVSSSPWGTTWGSIPHTIPPYNSSATYPKDENYLYEHPDFTNYRGDICVFLSGREDVPEGNWRMPNAAEFAVGKLVGGQSSTYTTDNWGGGTELVAWMKLEFGSGEVIFPISGGRSMVGTLGNVTKVGSYWTGTPYSNHPENTRAYITTFTSAGSTWNPNDHTTKAGAGTVRCVRN